MNKERIAGFAWWINRAWKAAVLAACAFGAAAPAFAQVAIPGTFKVGADGAATYAMPIRVPAGVAGMEPSLALVYNSHAGNGLLGVGWSLAGLSAITYCPHRSPFVSIGWAGDNLCLDGRRLTDHGGAEFRTIIDEFTSVTHITGGGWLVRTRDGRRLEYGNTADSWIKQPDLDPQYTDSRAWLLNKVTDAFGNYMTFTYTLDTSAGTAYPASITYTANDTAATKLAATSSIVFDIDTSRADMPNGYVKGLLAGNRGLLKGITTYNGTQKVLSYKLTYEDGYDTGRKRLKQVQVCDSACTSYLPATKITYATTSAAGRASEPSAVTSRNAGTTTGVANQDPSLLSGSNDWFALDPENTGKVGFFHTAPTGVKVWHSNGDGTFRISTSTAPNTVFGSVAPTAFRPMDFNGDGIPDLLVDYITQFTMDGAGCMKGVLMGDGAGDFVKGSSFNQGACASTGFDLYSDLNGDGMVDFVHIVPLMNYSPSFTVGDGTFTSPGSTVLYHDLYSGGTWQQIDLNGDGLQDYLHFGDNSGGYAVWVASEGTGYFDIAGTTTDVDKSLLTGIWLSLDVNGDGLADLVHVTTASGASQGSGYVWINQGNTRFVITPFTTSVDKVAPVAKYSDSSTADAWIVADYNGDGRADLVHMADASGAFYVWLSDGKGGFTVTAHKRADDTALTSGVWKAADITGTGVLDLVHFLDGSGNFKVWTMPRVDRDVPVSIDNGAGLVYRFTEKTLPQMLGADATKGGSYTRAAASAYPDTLTTVVPPLHVVTDSYESDGLGGDYHVGYNYGSARFERTGRGFAGFEWFETIDSLTSLTQRTTFSQTFPYTGMTVSTTRGTSHASPDSLSRVVNTLDCMNPVASSAGQACSVVPGGIYYPFITKTEVSGSDLDGTALPMTRTTVARADLDLYGNAGKISETTLDADGTSNSAQDFGTVVTRTFDNDATNWRLGRVLTSSVVATGPATPAPVTPGAGSSVPPKAPSPTVPPQVFVLQTIINSLIVDN